MCLDSRDRGLDWIHMKRTIVLIYKALPTHLEIPPHGVCPQWPLKHVILWMCPEILVTDQRPSSRVMSSFTCQRTPLFLERHGKADDMG